MTILGYGAGLLGILLLGYLINLILRYKKVYPFSLIECIVHSFLLGFIANGLILFLLGWIGVPYSFFTMIVYSSIILILFFGTIFFFKQRIIPAKMSIFNQFITLPKRTKVAAYIGTIRILAKLIMGGISILSVPTYQDDSFVNRNYRAKVFFYRESLVLDETDDDFLGNGYRQYPLSTYLNRVYLLKLAGERTEGGANFVSFLYYLIALVLTFTVIFRMTNRVDISLLGVYLLSSVPLYYIHGTNPYFDVFLSVYFLLATFMLYALHTKIVTRSIAAVYIGILGFTKAEGLIVYTTALIVGYLLFHFFSAAKKIDLHYYRTVTKIVFITVLINLPFIIFKLIYGLGFANGNEKLENISFSLHPEIFPAMQRAFFTTGSYNLLFLFVVIASISLLFRFFSRPKNDRSPAMIVLFITLCAFFIITVIYLTTFTYSYVLDQTGINRTIMQFTPNLILLISLFLYSQFPVRNVKKI